MLRMHAWEGGAEGVRWRGIVEELAAARRRLGPDARAAMGSAARVVRHTHMPTRVLHVVADATLFGVRFESAQGEISGLAVGPLTRARQRRHKRGARRWFVQQLLQCDGFHAEMQL